VQVIRSGIQESTHLVDVAVVDPQGDLLAWAGDPSRMLFSRSSMKPLQGAVSLTLAGLELEPRETAVVCSSHNGEPVHLEAVRSVLRKAGVAESALRCPPRRSWEEAAEVDGEGKRPIHSDCSGKHTGMLAACRAQGWDLGSYPEPGHPLQKVILRTVLEVTGLDDVRVGVDGCGVPVHHVPLLSMARVYARLSAPDLWGKLEPIVAQVVRAMTADPYMVGGRDRVDTALMKARPNLVAKEGAEGLLCVGVLDRKIGVAARVRDGNWRAAGPAMIRALELLEVLEGAALASLAEHARPPVLGGYERVGEIRAEFALRRV
jgi:L-asparaginase II